MSLPAGKLRSSILMMVIALSSGGCAVTTSVLGMGKTSQSATRPECVDLAEGGVEVLLRSSSISGDLLATRSAGDVPGVPSGWLRLTTPVAVAAQGNDVFIADLALRKVLKFNRGSQRAEVFVNAPDMTIDTGLYLDRALSLYMTEPLARRVTQFDLDGRPVRTFGPQGETANPVATVVDDARGEIFIADQLIARINVFNRNGGLVRAIGAGTAADALRFTSIKAMANAGDQLYVVDQLAGHVVALGMNGNFRYAFGESELTTPTTVAADQENRVFVSDGADSSIKVYRGGQLQSVVGAPGDAAGIAFRGVSALWAGDDSLYVADAERGAVDIFEVQQPCR
jgi:DNA-binding beta-propeller fold protein YncE